MMAESEVPCWRPVAEGLRQWLLPLLLLLLLLQQTLLLLVIPGLLLLWPVEPPSRCQVMSPAQPSCQGGLPVLL